MAQQTRVFQLDAAAIGRLKAALDEGLPPDAEWRTAPHAHFAVKAMGVVLTCYRSGKLVVQGSAPDAFVDRFLAAATSTAPKAAGKSTDAELAFDAACFGSDEAGKGDFFGPLVVAAVHAGPEHAAELAALRVADSKTLSDDRARMLAGRIDALLDSEVLVLQPPEYNRRWEEAGNLNRLLAELHATALDRLATRHADARRAIVDRFAAEALVAEALRSRGRVFEELIQVPRAERHPAVAAASILARAGFLDGLAACAESCGCDLHKGAGEPVDVAARRVVAVGGTELLGQVAKLHFKNTGRAVGGGR